MSHGEHCVYSDVEPESNRGPRRNTVQPDGDWVDTDTAMKLLSTTKESFYAMSREYGRFIHRKSRSRKGKGPRGAGWLWYRPDLIRVAIIRRECKLTLDAALRVFDALNKGRIA